MVRVMRTYLDSTTHVKAITSALGDGERAQGLGDQLVLLKQ